MQDLGRVKQEVLQARKKLERAWCQETRYPGTLFREGDPVSKGQCGVSSLYLAKQLGQECPGILFCEGDAYFQGYSIPNHCWLKLPTDAGILVIDVTADQSGYGQGVVCALERELRRMGIRYQPEKELPVSEIRSENLLERLERLGWKD